MVNHMTSTHFQKLSKPMLLALRYFQRERYRYGSKRVNPRTLKALVNKGCLEMTMETGWAGYVLTLRGLNAIIDGKMIDMTTPATRPKQGRQGPLERLRFGDPEQDKDVVHFDGGYLQVYNSGTHTPTVTVHHDCIPKAKEGAIAFTVEELRQIALSIEADHINEGSKACMDQKLVRDFGSYMARLTGFKKYLGMDAHRLSWGMERLFKGLEEIQAKATSEEPDGLANFVNAVHNRLDLADDDASIREYEAKLLCLEEKIKDLQQQVEDAQW